MSKQPSKSVFVGNIPYGLTEEQITEIFSSAGKVLSFRLVYDRETGRPKGFGFAEYPDADSAASAVRNLNDYEIMNRKLRVDFSNDGADDETAAPAGYQNTPMPANGVPIPPPLVLSQNGTGTSLPPLPMGTDLPPGLTCPDAISRTLTTLPPAQLLDVLSQMKSLVTADAARATELLRQAPQLSFAIFQALLLMGLVSAESLTSVVEPAVAAPPSTVPAPPTIQASASLQNTQYPIPIPGQTFATYAPPPHLSGQIGTPPVQNMAAYPPPPTAQYQPPRAQQPPPQAQSQPDTDALVQQVLAMPQSIIDQLPPAERAQLLALRATFLQQGNQN